MKVLVTGGLGYIGSHTCVQLIAAGFTPVVLDNLHNSKLGVVSHLKKILQQDVQHYVGDIRDRDLLKSIFAEHDIKAVIHFAGLKAVGESVEKPLEYYENNVYGTLALVQEMKAAGVKSIIFSSSATVYGDPQEIPISETTATGATTNPYGRSKFMVEECLKDLHIADPEWSITLLRYFNPVGSHPSGLLGEDPQGIPNNLMPFIAQVAVGRREQLAVFGNDYPTKDGTGVRDYIHVMDLADGHIAALQHVGDKAGVHIYNLGTGTGTSVLEMVDAFASASGQSIKYQICDRRPGDIAECWADPSKAKNELNWQAQYGIAEMTADTWRWQSNYPNGFSD
ncbi:UDP-glucose 4-epimerase [Neiella marina]|uniref:UDP-glucose 4-epimerase n=1 Tax=Neiella marina TaxID=508461 RepID=A0A8J2U8G2_9GAMM|nr:UDP-glucose 4-epimerase GalE [Neiella marina]GGA85593.1 UDP-glucose 4-epimerase [Neiella marina]